MRTFCFPAIAMLFLVPSLLADGTLATSDIVQTLEPTNPPLVKALRSEFDLDKDAVGSVIGRAVNPQLAGTRIGPYTIRGRLKSQPGLELLITLKTEIIFFDRHHRKTKKVASSDSVQETLVSIEFEAAKP
jgi:hypothetical protein